MTTHQALESARALSVIDVKDFGAETVRIGDLNDDGAPDLLFVQSQFYTREISCLTATTIHGDIIWQHGTPSVENGRMYSDLPVQVYDFDNDGRNEVLYVKQARYLDPPPPAHYAYRERGESFDGPATMVVLDAATGVERRRFDVPAPADDCFLFADLTGRGRRQHLVLKDRHWKVFGVSYEGEQLWRRDGYFGHFLTLEDIDADGRDEVFDGFSLIDHDGALLWEIPHKMDHTHQDAACITKAADGSWRLLFGNGGMHCLGVDGKHLWYRKMDEAQHVVLGHFRPEMPGQQAVVINRGERTESGQSQMYLFDLDGNEIWCREDEPGAWAAGVIPIDWTSGTGTPKELLVYGRGPGRPALIYDGYQGHVIETLPMQYGPGRSDADRQTPFYATRADLWGDSRHEAILSGPRGVCIYTNRRPLAIPTLYNNTYYQGM